jgi:hypothetical protein
MANLKLQVSVAADVTKSDTVNIQYPGDNTASPNTSAWPCVLYVGTGGNVRVLTAGGNDVILNNVAAGTFIPIQVVRVYSTNTTASDILALW